MPGRIKKADCGATIAGNGGFPVALRCRTAGVFVKMRL